MTLSREQFLEHFAAAKSLQEGLSGRLRRALTEQPPPSDRRASLDWVQRTMIPVLQDYRRWGESFLALTEAPPPGIEVDIPSERAEVRTKLEELTAQLRALGADTSD